MGRVLQETMTQFTSSLDSILEAVLITITAEEEKLLREIDMIHRGLVASDNKQCSEVLSFLKLGEKLGSPLGSAQIPQDATPQVESQVTVAGVESLRALVAAVRTDGVSGDSIVPTS